MRTMVLLMIWMTCMTCMTCVLSLGGCTTSAELRPEAVPFQQEVAPASVEVLQVTIEATASGYRVVKQRRARGAPTEHIIQDREVRITALDAQGVPVRTITVENPRHIRTTGSTKPAEAVVDRAVFTVSFANPEKIASIDVKVERGPNARLEQRMAIDR